MLVTTCLGKVVGFVPLLGWLVAIVLGLLDFCLFILWCIGIIRAAKGDETPIPFLGWVKLI